MKKITGLILALLMCTMLASCKNDNNETTKPTAPNEEQGDDFTVGSLVFERNNRGNYDVAGFKKTTGNDTAIVIPNTVNSHAVTGIAAEAFKSENSITSVTIPDSVTYIGDFAFTGCNGLTEIVIPDSVTEIGQGAFKNCTNLKKITLPAGLEEISSFIFEGCTSLETITIPATVKEIGNSAFKGCTSLTAVTIPESVEAVGNTVFYGCEKLKSVTFKGDKSDVTMGDAAFAECHKDLVISDTKK